MHLNVLAVHSREIACEGLAQGPYMAARVGFKSATFWMQGTKPITEPPRPCSNEQVIKLFKTNCCAKKYSSNGMVIPRK